MKLMTITLKLCAELKSKLVFLSTRFSREFGKPKWDNLDEMNKCFESLSLISKEREMEGRM